MAIEDIDRIVAATLAGAKAAAEKKEKPFEYVQEYERILRVIERRKKSEAHDEDVLTSVLPDARP